MLLQQLVPLCNRCLLFECVVGGTRPRPGNFFEAGDRPGTGAGGGHPALQPAKRRTSIEGGNDPK